MGIRKYGDGMVVDGAVYQDIKNTSQNVIYVSEESKTLKKYLTVCFLFLFKIAQYYSQIVISYLISTG